MRYLVMLLCAVFALPGVAAGEGETYFAFGGSQVIAFSEDILADPLDLLILVNNEHMLDDTYPPEDDLHALVETTVRKASSTPRLARAVASEALTAMFDAAKADGANLVLYSAYRSHRQQTVLYENRLKRIGHDDGYQLKGGASEHQTGLAFDIVNKVWAEKDRLHRDFYDTTEGRWLDANCAEYGFVIRYPDGRQDITGIKYEPWHLRYVGVEVARYMTEQGLTLEEFHAQHLP